MNEITEHIRPATTADAEAILRIYAPYVEHTAVSFEWDVPTVKEMQRRMTEIQIRYPYLVAETADGIVGYTYATHFKSRAAYDWAVETTIYVAGDHRRHGTGQRLYRTLEAALHTQNVLNMNACIACPREDDLYLTRDSLTFHQKMGFETVGRFHNCGYKFHRWYDMVWMEKSIGEHTPEPLSVQAFQGI